MPHSEEHMNRPSELPHECKTYCFLGALCAKHLPRHSNILQKDSPIWQDTNRPRELLRFLNIFDAVERDGITQLHLAGRRPSRGGWGGKNNCR